MDFTEIIRAIFIFLADYKLVTNLLSTVVSLLFALIIFQFLRRFKLSQNDAWAKPFAWAFVVLAVLHSVSPIAALLKQLEVESPYLTYIFYLSGSIGSSLSNYLFFLVGVVLGLFHLNLAFAKQIKYAALVLLLLSALIGTLGDIQLESPQGGSQWWLWARIPDAFFSTAALLFVGWVLYRNVISRRNPRMARLALVAGLIYAALFVLYGLHPLMAQAGKADWLVGSQAELLRKVEVMDAVVMFIALPLKFGLFFPAVTLMLMIADPVAGIRRLLKNVTHGDAEFLDNNGVARSIYEEIKASRVELYIKLPGMRSNMVARYSYSGRKGGDGQPEKIPFDEHSDYGWVMSSPGRELLYRLLNYSDQTPEPDYLREPLPAETTSLIAVPIFYHNASIGCLKAELRKKNSGENEKFAEADLQNIRRFAALLSPNAQDSRRVAASKEISHRLTKIQVEARDYDIKRDIRKVADIAQDILVPLATGISIKAGFRHYEACFPEDSPYCSMLEQQLNSPNSETARAGGRKNLDFLHKELKIASSELIGKSDGEQPLGKLVLATHPKVKEAERPSSAPVSELIDSPDMSNLITDAVLNFIRGSLNEVTRELNIRMSRLGAAKGPAAGAGPQRQDNVPAWFETMDETARTAGLRWAVAKYSDRHEWLGGEVEMVKQLEDRGVWRDKGKVDKEGQTTNVYEAYAPNIDIALCTLEPPERGTSHVIRISLRECEQTVWLGVGNPTFELELDYLSPWMGFILRFGEIAHTSLRQILSKQKQEKLEKEAAAAHERATAYIITGTFIHQMVNQVLELTASLTNLADAVEHGSLKGDENEIEMILELGGAVGEIEELMKLFSGVTKPDDRRPCSLGEAYQYAFNLLRSSLTRYNIKVNADDLNGHVVDVPFHVVAYALANLLNNAKDAIRDGKVKNGLIEIWAEPAETMIQCHVKDNGPGVPPHILEQLFESGGKSSKSYGSGLGLYLTAHSLRENRGLVKMTSPGPCPPTTFTLCFPKQRKA